MKKYIEFSFTVLILMLANAASAGAQTCAPASVGLVSWYAADGNALDSRSRNNGTLENGATFAAGQNGQAFSFNGTSSFVQINNNSALDFGTADFSVEVWFNLNTTSGEQTLFQKRIGDFPNTQEFLLESNNGNLRFLIRETTANENNLEVAGLVTPNTWNHFAAVRQGNNSKIYFNGTLVGNQTAGTNVNTGTGGTAVFGKLLDFDLRFVNGRIDEPALYNRALSASEITAIFNAGTAGKCKPTATVAPGGQVAWFAGDGNASDSAGTNNGTLEGADHAIGKVGQAFNFTAQQFSVSIPNSPALFPSNALSIEAWVNPSNYASCNAQYRIFHTVRTTLRGYVTFIDCSNQRFVGQIFDSSGTANSITSNAVFPAGAWAHFAMTWDGANLRIYVNGVLDNTAATTISSIGTNSDPLRIGNESNFGFLGQIDELSLYNRALNDAEVTSIFNAGIAGKLKQNQTIDTNSVVSLWQGETNANDTRGANNGAFPANTYGSGKVGQAFILDGTDDSVNFGSLPPMQNFSFEAWVNPVSAVNDPLNQELIVGQASFGGQMAVRPGTNGGMRVVVQYRDTLNSFAQLTSTVDIPLNSWSHLNGTFDGTTLKIYINGILNAQTNPTNTTVQSCNTPYFIGGFQPVTDCNGVTNQPFQFFNGRIDEAAVYNRALTAAEVRANYEAGNALSTVVGDARVIFPTVSSAGTTQQIPLDLSLLPALPVGSTSTGLTYDIATSAAFAGSPVVCFNLSSITNSTVFSNLRIAHLENNAWTNRTNLASIDFATKTICTSGLASLSPFAIVNGFAPSAANASISGRVLTPQNSGISGASVTITNSNGEIFQSRTGTFGYYRFENLRVGETYVLSVSAKRYSFNNPTRVIVLNDDLTEADFVAEGK